MLASFFPRRPCAPRKSIRIVCNAKSSLPYARIISDAGAKLLGCTASILVTAGSAWGDADKFGEFAASGFIFKDTVDVIAFEDPEVKNVILYLTEMQRSLSDKLTKDFFNNPSQASLACVVTGPPRIDSVDKIRGREGKEVLTQSRNFSLFQQKALRVRRLYDEKRNTVIYVAYSTRLTSAADEGAASVGRYKCGSHHFMS